MKRFGVIGLCVVLIGSSNLGVVQAGSAGVKIAQVTNGPISGNSIVSWKVEIISAPKVERIAMFIDGPDANFAGPQSVADVIISNGVANGGSLLNGTSNNGSWEIHMTIPSAAIGRFTPVFGVFFQDGTLDVRRGLPISIIATNSPGLVYQPIENPDISGGKNCFASVPDSRWTESASQAVVEPNEVVWALMQNPRDISTLTSTQLSSTLGIWSSVPDSIANNAWLATYFWWSSKPDGLAMVNGAKLGDKLRIELTYKGRDCKERKVLLPPREVVFPDLNITYEELISRNTSNFQQEAAFKVAIPAQMDISVSKNVRIGEEFILDSSKYFLLPTSLYIYFDDRCGYLGGAYSFLRTPWVGISTQLGPPLLFEKVGQCNATLYAAGAGIPRVRSPGKITKLGALYRLGSISFTVSPSPSSASVSPSPSPSNAKPLTVKTFKTTIKCIRGKSLLKVTSINPKCPSGYKKQ